MAVRTIRCLGFDLVGADTTDVLDLSAAAQAARIVGLHLSPGAVITARMQLDSPADYTEKTGLKTLQAGGGFIWTPPERGFQDLQDLFPKFIVPVGRKFQIVHSGAAGGTLWYVQLDWNG